ncbi:uroporphyrinogen-III synthase [Blattabacterium cuenoti]|uniref:uroporphyrinogen-III synthase n=1 Tax=Blattabacterium cuenoti TaxID=1653831 RepID=UPI00163C9310|nr:uroporphyrinogen-III synthase [Blattabacterium cuenoti]
MKTNNILISQPITNLNSPYLKLRKNKNVKIDFRSFIDIKGVSNIEILKQKINFSDFTEVIFLSKNSIDYYFKLYKSMRFKISVNMKYICLTESIANYLQKYIVYRKRKIHIGNMYFQDIIPYINQHSHERFLLPSSDTLTPEIPKILNQLNIYWKRAVLYKTTYSNLSDLKHIYYYDLLVFFSPICIKSLFENFPKFNQKNTQIATFGQSTLDAAYKAGLKISITAPTPENPSMMKALEKYIKNKT